MQVSIPLYDRFTVLDAIGPYQVLSELPGLEIVFTAQWHGPVTAERRGAPAAPPRAGAGPGEERHVSAGKSAPGAGVSAGIDMARALAARTQGDDAAMAAQLGIEYAPRPPFNAGSPATAPEKIVAAQRARSRF